MLERWDGGREPTSRSQVDSIYAERRRGGKGRVERGEGRGHKTQRTRETKAAAKPYKFVMLRPDFAPPPHASPQSLRPSLPLGRAVRPCPQRREERKAESSMRHLGASHVFTHRFCLPTKIDLDTCGVVSRLTLLTPWHGMVW